MAEMDTQALLLAVGDALVNEHGDAVTVAGVEELKVDLLFFDMVPGRVSAREDGMLSELLVGPPDGPAQSWEPTLHPWVDDSGPLRPTGVANRIWWLAEGCVPDSYLDDVFSQSYTRLRASNMWTRNVKELS